MKYLLTTILILVASVTFSYYLLANPNFVPITELGEYNWINIFTMIILGSLIVLTFLNLLTFLVFSLFKKEMSKKERIIKSLKISFLLTLGVIVVFILNFFHILNWIWGVSILLVVLIFTFVI